MHFRTPPYCYWWLIMKKRSWKLYRSPNPKPTGVRKCNSARLGCPKCHPVLIDLGCPKCLSVGQRCHRLLLNVNDGWETFLNFPLIITSWAGLVRSELNLFFHPNAYSLILAKLKGTYSNVRNNKEKGHVSAKNLQFNNKLSNKSFYFNQDQQRSKNRPFNVTFCFWYFKKSLLKLF